MGITLQTTISPHTLSVGKHLYSSSGRVDTMNFTWRGSCLGNQVNFRAPSSGESWSSESSRITKGFSFVALDKKTGNWSNTPLVDWKRRKMKINTMLENSLSICTWTKGLILWNLSMGEMLEIWMVYWITGISTSNNLYKISLLYNLRYQV